MWLSANRTPVVTALFPFGRDSFAQGQCRQMHCTAPCFITKKGETTMLEVVGTFNTAICYTGTLEAAAAGQIKAVCDQNAFSDCKIRIMPMSMRAWAAPLVPP